MTGNGLAGYIDMILHGPVRHFLGQRADITQHPATEIRPVFRLSHGFGGEGLASDFVVLGNKVDNVVRITLEFAADKVKHCQPCFRLFVLLNHIVKILIEHSPEPAQFCGAGKRHIQLVFENGQIPGVGVAAVEIQLENLRLVNLIHIDRLIVCQRVLHVVLGVLVNNLYFAGIAAPLLTVNIQTAELPTIRPDREIGGRQHLTDSVQQVIITAFQGGRADTCKVGGGNLTNRFRSSDLR